MLLKATLPLGDEWLELQGWQRIDIEIKEDEGTCDEPLIRDRVELPRYHEDGQGQDDVTAFLQWSRGEVTTWGIPLEEDCDSVDEDIVSFSRAPLDIPELPEKVAVLADWEVTRVWAAAVDAGFLRLFRAPDVPRTLTVFNLFDDEASSEPSWVPWQEGLSFSEVIRQVWPELRDGTWDFQAFWPDTALAAQPPGCVVVIGPQEKLLMHSPLHCWYIEIILQLEDHCASYVKAEFTQPELLIKDVLARAPVTAQAHSSEMRIEHNGILLQPYHRVHVQHGDVLTFVVGRSVAQRLVGGRWDPNLDEQIADRLMVAWQYHMVVPTYMREGEYLCLRPGRRPPRGMGILRGAINFYHDEGWLRRQMKRLWADFREAPFTLAQFHPSAYSSSPLLRRFALLIVVDLGQLGVTMPVIMETSDGDSIPLIGSHVLAFRVRQYISKARLLHIWRIWREAEELHAVELLHNGDRVEHDEEFLVAAGDYFFVRATPRECKRPRLDQQLTAMNRHLTAGRMLMQRQMVRREVLDVFVVYQRYALAPSTFRCGPGHWFTGLRTCVLDHLATMWLENDRTNALILEVKPQPPGRLHGKKIVILAMPGSYFPTQSVILVGLHFSDVQYRQGLVVPQILTRLQFLQELGLVKECGLYGVMRCLIHVGFAPWEQQDSHTRLIAHASFLQIWVDGRDPGACQEHPNEDDSGFEEDDEQSPLQIVWHGVETLGIAQLPPPGNPVRFDPRVSVREGGSQFCCRDPQCTNDFWLGLVQEMTCSDNPFVQAFLKQELVQTLEEHEEVFQVIDKNADEEVQREDRGVLMKCLEGEHLLPCVEDIEEVPGELPMRVISLVDTLGDIYAPFVDDRTQNEPYWLTFS